MEKLVRNWKRTHPHVRKPVVLIIGVFIILLSGTIGWLPGPGGIPLFLLGIAVLASEFTWADRLKNYILSLVYQFGGWYRQHRILGTLIILVPLSISLYIMLTLFYSK